MAINNRIYADNAATTPVLPEVVEAMLPCFQQYWGNPSSMHEDGQAAAQLLSDSRKRIASLLGASSENEIYFTSCGSESDNWAIKGAAHATKKGRNKIITTKIEHHAALHACKALEKEGYTVTYLDVDAEGFVDLVQLEKEAVRTKEPVFSMNISLTGKYCVVTNGNLYKFVV